MKRRWIVAFALIMTVCVATTGAATATSHTSIGVVGEHDTASEFQTGTLTGTVVDGTGSQASVGLPLADGYENEPTDTGAPNAWETYNYGAGDTVNVTTLHAATGTQSVYISNDNIAESGIRPQTQPYDTPQTLNISVSIYADDNDQTFLTAFEGTPAGSNRIFNLGMKNGDLVAINNTGTKVISTIPDNNEWVSITVHDINASADTYDVTWSSPGGSGTVTNITATNAFTTGYTTTGYSTFSGDGFFDAFQIGNDTGTYTSDPVNVTDPTEGRVNLTLTNATATVAWQAYTAGSWSTQTSNTYTSSGIKTTTLPTSSSTRWRVQVDFEYTGSEPTAELQRDALYFTNHAPTASNLTPADGAKLSSSSTTFSVDIADPEFPTAQGDTVTATLYIDGTQAYQTSITSNQTISTSETLSEGGSHTYHWVLQDSYGESTTTATKTITVPSTLYIRNASNASELVKDNVNVSVEFVTDDGQIITRETSDGTISLSGLNIGQEFVVRASANGWVTRRTVITSLYEQSSVYLINESSTQTHDITFKLEDETGEYPPSESRLFVKAPADPDGDGNTTYVTVAAGPFDASDKFSTTLIHDKQYRLIVENRETGNRRVLGSYVPLADAVETLPIGQVQFKNQIQADTAFGATLDTESGSNVVRFNYRDAREVTSSLEYEIYKINSSGEFLVVANTSVSVSGSSVTVSEPVPTNDSESLTFKIQWHANRDGRPDVGGTAKVGAIEQFAGQWPIDSTVLSLMAWVGAIAITGFVVIIDPPGAAMVFVATVSLFTAIGAMTVNPIALGLAGAAAVAFNVGRIT